MHNGQKQNKRHTMVDKNTTQKGLRNTNSGAPEG